MGGAGTGKGFGLLLTGCHGNWKRLCWFFFGEPILPQHSTLQIKALQASMIPRHEKLIQYNYRE